MELALSSIGIVTFIFVAARVFQWLNGSMVGRNAAYQATRVDAGSSNPGSKDFYVTPGVDLTPNDGRGPGIMGGGAGSPGLSAPDHQCGLAETWVAGAQDLRGDVETIVNEGRWFMGIADGLYHEAAELISKGPFAFPASCNTTLFGLTIPIAHCDAGVCDPANGANQLEHCARLHEGYAQHLADAASNIADIVAVLQPLWNDYQTQKGEADAVCEDAVNSEQCTTDPTGLGCALLVAVCLYGDEATQMQDAADALQNQLEAYGFWPGQISDVDDTGNLITSLQILAWTLLHDPTFGADAHNAEATAKHDQAGLKLIAAAIKAAEARDWLQAAVYLPSGVRRSVESYNYLLFAEALERNAAIYCGKAPWAR
jgi:hypothetical protein